MATARAQLAVLLASLAGAGLVWSRAEEAAGPGPAPAATPPGPPFVYECDVGGNLEICSVPSSGGLEQRLAESPAEDLYPRWTRDGTAIVFSSARTGNWQLWELVPGAGLHRRRESQTREWQSDPHPDGRQIAFLSDAGGPESLRVAGAGARGVGRVLLTHGPRVVLGNPHWSPDGKRLVLSSNRGAAGHHIYLVEAASGVERRISPLLSGACEPRFHPDGTKVAYVRRKHLTRERSQIMEYDLESGTERVLVNWPALNYDPTWSPDGNELAFVSDIAGGGVQSIYRMRLADGKSWRVTFKYPSRHPDYRP